MKVAYDLRQSKEADPFLMAAAQKYSFSDAVDFSVSYALIKSLAVEFANQQVLSTCHEEDLQARARTFP